MGPLPGSAYRSSAGGLGLIECSRSFHSLFQASISQGHFLVLPGEEMACPLGWMRMEEGGTQSFSGMVLEENYVPVASECYRMEVRG